MRVFFNKWAPFVLVMFMLQSGFGGNIESLSLGSKAPMLDAKFKDISGSELSLSSAKRENGLLVVFSCNTCPYVRAWEGRYPELASKAKEANIGIIMLNSNEARRDGGESLDDMKSHAKENGYLDKSGKPLFAYAVDKDHKLADAFGATRTPETFLFDKDLKLVYKGAIDDNSKSEADVKESYLKNAIMALSKGDDIKTASTKSIGCSIKRL